MSEMGHYFRFRTSAIALIATSGQCEKGAMCGRPPAVKGLIDAALLVGAAMCPYMDS